MDKNDETELLKLMWIQYIIKKLKSEDIPIIAKLPTKEILEEIIKKSSDNENLFAKIYERYGVNNDVAKNWLNMYFTQEEINNLLGTVQKNSYTVNATRTKNKKETLSKDELAKLCETYNAKEIAKITDYSLGYVYAKLKKYSLKPQKKYKRNTLPYDSLYKKYILENKKCSVVIKELSKELKKKITKKSVEYWLRKYNIKKQAVIAEKNAKLRDVLYQKYIKENKTYAEIARELGLKPKYIEYISRKFGLKKEKKPIKAVLDLLMPEEELRNFLYKEYIENNKKGKQIVQELSDKFHKKITIKMVNLKLRKFGFRKKSFEKKT